MSSVPSRRTLIVLGSLMGSMTLASGLLLALNPGPIGQAPVVAPLASVEMGQDPVAELFKADRPLSQNWNKIEIRFSGRNHSSAESIDQAHRQVGLTALGDHFVIGNGQSIAGMPATSDGEIEVGKRWRLQSDAVRVTNNGPITRTGTISICLIGDGNQAPPTEKQMRDLVWLVQQLQARFNIPASRIDLTDEALLFQDARFRSQLLSLR